MESRVDPIFYGVVWGLTLGGVVFVIGFFGGLLLYPDSNLAPILGILFGPPALIAGFVAGLLVASSRRWGDRQMFVFLGRSAALVGLALFAYMLTQRP